MFSVIIPTYKEEKYIGRLLESIKKQHLQPSEIIVADRLSGDRTREIAKSFGCKIVEGGTIPVARNAGAKAAKEEILVFLDADCTLPAQDFFNKVIGQFTYKDVDVATCFTRDIYEKKAFPVPTQGVLNGIRFVNLITSKLFGKILGEAGAFIICKKKVLEELGWFKTEMKTMEDTDFFRRALVAGKKYTVIGKFVATSNRRYSKRGPISFLKIIGLTAATLLAYAFGAKVFKSLKKKYDKQTGEVGGGENPKI